MIGTSVMKELTTLNNKFFRMRRQERIISHDISIFMSVSTNGWKKHLDVIVTDMFHKYRIRSLKVFL